MNIYIGNIVCGTDPTKSLVKADYAVVVDTNGKISAVGPKAEIFDNFDGNIVRLSKFQLLMPGFIDAHLHAPQFPNIGLHTDLPLMDWLTKYTFPLENRFKDVSFAEKIYPAVIRQTLAGGTTTAAYFGSIHKESTLVLAKEAQKQGQRAFIGKTNMDLNPTAEYYKEENVQSSLKDTEWVINEMENLNSSLLEPIITPRFALSCSEGLMTKLGDLAKSNNLAIQTHISENRGEMQIVKDLFPRCKDYLEVYENHNLIGNRTLLAHGIHLSDDELSRICNVGASVVHCPTSNTNLMSGFFDAKHTSSQSVNIALGTDVAGGALAGMVEMMRNAESVSKSCEILTKTLDFHVDHRQAFLYGTLNGAISLGIDDQTGSLEVGKFFDAVIADLTFATAAEFLDDDTEEELLERFIHVGGPLSIRNVFVNGKEVVNKN